MNKAVKLSGALVVASLLAPAASAVQFYGLGQGGNALVSIEPSGAVSSTKAITGLSAGDILADLDVFFSGNSMLYGMGASGTLYRINPATGAAVVDTANAAVGSPVAIDFNPAADRLRIFSGGDLTYRLTPGTGVVTSDGSLTFAAGDANFGANPNLVAAAYINNVDNPGATTLFSVDADLNALIRHTVGPQFATLNTVGGLTLDGQAFDIGAMVGFDVFSPSLGINQAFISNGNDLYSVDLGTGMLTALGTVSGNYPIKSIAAAGVPDGGGLMPCLSVAMAGLMFLRSRRNQS